MLEEEEPGAGRDGGDSGAALRGHVSGAAGSDCPKVVAGALERDKEASCECRPGHLGTPRDPPGGRVRR